MAAVINRALTDLEKDRAAIKTSPRVKDEAMAWIHGPDCEAYCLVLDMDYTDLQDNRKTRIFRGCPMPHY